MVNAVCDGFTSITFRSNKVVFLLSRKYSWLSAYGTAIPRRLKILTQYIRNGITYSLSLMGGSILIINQQSYINLDRNEQSTECAEVAILTKALKISHSEAANVLLSKQRISKTTVLNKVHSLLKIFRTFYSKDKNVCSNFENILCHDGARQYSHIFLLK